MALDLGGIEFYAGPVILGAPDDLDAVIREFLAGAKRQLLVAVQEIDSRADRRGHPGGQGGQACGSRLILEGDYLRRAAAAGRPVGDGRATTRSNRVIHAALLRAGVDVITDLNPAIFHQKFVVRDPGEPTAAVLTGSTNFTLTDTGTNPPDNTAQRRQQPQPRGGAARAAGRQAVPGRVPPAARRARSATCTSGTSPARPSSGWAGSGSSRCSRRGTARRWRS